ncbi:MAG: TVP38/TMEM64 family protein, partial [Tepidiformaceae bacterium]
VNFDWISFVAGMTSIRFTPFFVYSALGMLLPTFVAVAAGDGLGRDIRITLAYGGLWVAAIVASAGYFWYRRRRTLRAGEF